MYLWDANILRAFGQGQATLRSYLLRVPWSEIALPSVVVAEVLRGRCDFALKATPAEDPSRTNGCWTRSRCFLNSRSSCSTPPVRP
jgi:predicted nucleic acid-binding protein